MCKYLFSVDLRENTEKKTPNIANSEMNIFVRFLPFPMTSFFCFMFSSFENHATSTIDIFN